MTRLFSLYYGLEQHQNSVKLDQHCVNTDTLH